MFALPGRWNDPLSEGCNRLIRVGAGIVTNPTDILDYFHMKLQSGVRDESSGAHLAKKEKMVYSAIDSYPRHADDIMEESRRSAAARESFRAELERLGIFVYPSDSNFLLCDFGREVGPIEARLLEKQILVRQCMNFPGIDDGRHLRLAVKDEASNARFIKELEEAL